MKKNTLIWLAVLVFMVAGLVWLIKMPVKPGKLDAFATCIKDSGATYYGAFWCQNCKNQNAKFGVSAKLLPYVERSTLDGRGQLPLCAEAKIMGYPTWDFAGATRESGEISLERLSELSGCPLPAEVSSK